MCLIWVHIFILMTTEEYWNDRFFAIFLLFCIMPKSAAAGLRFTFRATPVSYTHLAFCSPQVP